MICEVRKGEVRDLAFLVENHRRNQMADQGKKKCGIGLVGGKSFSERLG